ncbi:MAG: thioredoxin-like domain-containing protein [Gemmatimonadaceae bacterium]
MLFLQLMLLSLCLTMVSSTQSIAQTRAAATAPQPALISGIILGSDGRPMARADVVIRAVHSQDPDGAPEIARTRADARGHFAIASTYTGGARLYLFGTSHNMKSVGLDLSNGYRLQMHTRLSRVRYLANLDSVRVAGDFNAFRTDTSARLLQRSTDGSYTLDIPVKSDSLSYTFLRLAQRGTASGTTNDDHMFTGTDYHAIARTSAGFAHITFEPARIVRDTAPSHTEYIGGAEARAARLSDTISAHREQYRQLLTNKISSNAAAWTISVQRATRALATERSPMVREMLLLELMQLAQMGGAVPPRIGRLALNELGPGSSAWTTSESLSETLALLPQWVADSVLHLMRPVMSESFTASDSARLTSSVAKLAARFDSASLLATNAGAQAQWMQLGVAATFGWIPGRSAQILARMQAQHPTRLATLFALEQWGSQQALRKSVALPALNVATVSDTNVRITNAQLNGKTVLIDFWATWCGPCVGEMSYLHDAYKQFKGKGFEILSISADSSTKDVAAFRDRRWPMPWLNAWVPGVISGEQFRTFEIFAVPRVILVGPDGTIVATGQELRGAALGATLRLVLGPP